MLIFSKTLPPTFFEDKNFWRNEIVINIKPTCCQIEYDDACFHSYIPSSIAEKHANVELDNTYGHKLYKK